MSSLAISAIVFVCIFAGAMVGMWLRSRLPEEHLNPDSRDVVKLGMGLIGTMTALVLGLLIASAKGSFDTQRNGLAQLASNVIMLDRALAHYGPETLEMRGLLKASLADMLQRTWPHENPQGNSIEPRTPTEGRYEAIFEKIQQLSPKNDNQRTLQTQAYNLAFDSAKTRWLLFAQRDSSIPTPFLVVMVLWLVLILGSFGLFAPRNTVAVATLLVSSLAIASAIFLILELDRPFDGMIQVSSAPLRNAMAVLGR